MLAPSDEQSSAVAASEATTSAAPITTEGLKGNQEETESDKAVDKLIDKKKVEGKESELIKSETIKKEEETVGVENDSLNEFKVDGERKSQDCNSNGDELKKEICVESVNCKVEVGAKCDLLNDLAKNEDEMSTIPPSVISVDKIENSGIKNDKENEPVTEANVTAAAIEVVDKVVCDVAEIMDKLINLKTSEPEEEAPPSGTVSSSFLQNQNEGDPLEEQSDDDDDNEENDAVAIDNGKPPPSSVIRPTLEVNPELQKIREEQVRNWLKFEQDNPSTSDEPLSQSSDSLLSSGSIDEADSLTDRETLQITQSPSSTSENLQGNGTENGGVNFNGQHHREDEDNQNNGNEDGEGNGSELMTVNGIDGMPRRVRFLTDQEGNLLISVFMSNTPTTPVSEESLSMLSNGGGGEENCPQSPNPSLIVSPPSLDESNFSLTQMSPSAPLEQEEQDRQHPVSPHAPVVQVEPTVLPQEQQHPSHDEDEGSNSSDETLSVSSCNSMIEIIPNNQKTGEVPPPPEDPSIIDVDENNNELKSSSSTQVSPEVDSSSATLQQPCFQLTPTDIMSETIDEVTEEETASTASSSQPPSFIVHEPTEGMLMTNSVNELHTSEEEALNIPEEGIIPHVTSETPIISKLPSIDENNNVVEVEEEEEEYQDLEGSADFNNPNPPEEMPELRPSTSTTCSSSSDGDAEEESQRMTMTTPPSADNSIPAPRPAQAFLGGVLSSSGDPKVDKHQHHQLVSLCIQEEHISAVALTIAKWESMSKTQSSENLNTAGLGNASPSPAGGNFHAPVTKTSSSPSPSKPIHKPLQVSLSAKPVQNMPQNQYQPLQIHQVVIHASSSTTAKDIKNEESSKKASKANGVSGHHHNGGEPIVVGKVPGWNCWGRKVEDGSTGHHDHNAQDQNGSSGGNANGKDSSNHPPTHDELIYAQPNLQAGSTMTNIKNPSAILKTYPKPLSKGEILMWLKEGEIQRAGLLLNYGQSHHPYTPTPVPVTIGGVGGPNNNTPVIVNWFFGLISRHQAEKYLHGQPSGTFLVRISTRIWGYTLSYKASSGRTKHFLISATNPSVPATLQAIQDSAPLPPQTGKQQRMSPFLPQGKYAFIGTNMTPYGSLISLIRHHSHAPITKLGGEKLISPCPGGPQVAGLESIFKSSMSS